MYLKIIVFCVFGILPMIRRLDHSKVPSTNTGYRITVLLTTDDVRRNTTLKDNDWSVNKQRDDLIQWTITTGNNIFNGPLTIINWKVVEVL